MPVDRLVGRAAGPIQEIAPSAVEEYDCPFLLASTDSDSDRVWPDDVVSFGLEAWGPSLTLLAPCHRPNVETPSPPTLDTTFDLADGKVQVIRSHTQRYSG